MGWGEFILQYQFNELDNRMSKLEKGQNITKTAEETAVELDREMSMDAKLISNFITQQVSVPMANKKKIMKRISRNLRKAEETECRESRLQKRYKGRWTRLQKKSKTQTTTKSVPPQKSESRSTQGRKSILQSPSRGRYQQVGAANSGMPKKRTKKKVARSKSD